MCKAEYTIPISETASVPVSASTSTDLLYGVTMLTMTLPAVSIVNSGRTNVCARFGNSDRYFRQWRCQCNNVSSNWTRWSDKYCGSNFFLCDVVTWPTIEFTIYCYRCSYWFQFLLLLFLIPLFRFYFCFCSYCCLVSFLLRFFLSLFCILLIFIVFS